MAISFSTIIANTYRKNDLYHRISRMREFGQNFSFQEKSSTGNVIEALDIFFDSVKEQERHRVALREWGSSLWSAFVTSGDQSVIIQDLYSKAGAVSLVVLYVPVGSFSEEQFDNLARAVRSIAGEEVITDIKVDPSTLGGCALSIHNKYYSYTLKDALALQHDTITTMISGVSNREDDAFN